MNKRNIFYYNVAIVTTVLSLLISSHESTSNIAEQTDEQIRQNAEFSCTKFDLKLLTSQHTKEERI